MSDSLKPSGLVGPIGRIGPIWRVRSIGQIGPIRPIQWFTLAICGMMLWIGGFGPGRVFASTLDPSSDSQESSTRTLDRVVALVDGQIITERDLGFWTWEELLRHPERREQPSLEVSREILQRLVDEVLLYHWADNRMRDIPEEEVSAAADREMTRLKELAPTEKIFQDWMEEAGYDFDMARKYVEQRERWMWLIRAALASRLNVRPGQIDRSEITRNETTERPVRLQLRHILLRCPTGTNDAETSRGMVRALAIRREILSGLSFREAAEEYSQDAATRASGGNLGWLAINEMDPTLAETAAKMKAGEISQPVRTSRGWHLIQLLDFDTPSSLILLRRVEEAHREVLEELHRERNIIIAPMYQIDTK